MSAQAAAGNGSGIDREAAAELLRWYQEAGVDIALEDAPVDRFSESAEFAAQQAARQAERKAERRPPPRPTSAAPRQPVSGRPITGQQPSATGGLANAAIPDEKAVANARELAASATDLDALREVMQTFDGCNLRRTAKNTVFADGNPQSKIMLIGEAPGREEDIQGLPFVGRSGQLLDRMLAAIGLDRTQVYITNVLAWRPPGNRNPTPHEVEICRPFIERHIELAAPEVVVFVGAVSAKLMLGATDGILKLRGRWTSYSTGNKQYDAIAMLHPAYLLRQPAQKRLAWQDMLKLKARLEKQAG